MHRSKKKSDKFRDIISDDVDLKIDDKSGMGVSNKGSGLQRLAIILLNIFIDPDFRRRIMIALLMPSFVFITRLCA